MDDDALDPWVVVSVVDYVTMAPRVRGAFQRWCGRMGTDLTWVVQVLVGDSWVAFDSVVRHPCGKVMSSAGVPHASRRVISNAPTAPRVVNSYLLALARQEEDADE